MNMTVTKAYCDRCRKEVIRPVERRLYLSGLGREGGYTLCNSCYDELCRWFIEKDKVSRDATNEGCWREEEEYSYGLKSKRIWWEPKTGKWMEYCFQNCFCSNCYYIAADSDIDEYKYCPNCGAYMRESEE